MLGQAVWGWVSYGTRGTGSRRNLTRVFSMTAIVQAMSRTVHSVREVHPLTQIAMFCAAGLFVSLLAMTYGLDLSPGFF
jgi:sugar phosphate permease